MKTWLIIIIISPFIILTALCAGHTWNTPLEIGRALTGDLSLTSRLIMEWRLPRVITAGLVGFLLGLSGTVFQGLFRNPLAEPWLLGSAGGAAVGATIAILVPLNWPMDLSLPFLAFLGAVGASFLVLSIAKVAGTLDTATLLLAGIAVSAVLSAIRSFMMLALSNESISLQVVLSWLLGAVQAPGPTGLKLAIGATLGALLIALSLSHGLDLLGLGEEMAIAYGLNVKQFVVLGVLAGSAMVAASVALGGVIAFVGLAAPHMARFTIGSGHKALLPVAGMMGAILVVSADTLARSLLPPGEIPLGLITAILGGPFFIFLLAKRARQ